MPALTFTATFWFGHILLVFYFIFLNLMFVFIKWEWSMVNGHLYLSHIIEVKIVLKNICKCLAQNFVLGNL